MNKIPAFVAVAALTLSLPAVDANAAQKSGASAVAPGQMAKKPGAKSAKYYAPGQQMKRQTRPAGTTGASGFAPGHTKNAPATSGVRTR